MADMLSANNLNNENMYNAWITAINMEQRTFMIKNFSRIAKIVQVSAMKVHFQIAERSLFYLNPDIHFRRMAYPPEREKLSGGGTSPQ